MMASKGEFFPRVPHAASKYSCRSVAVSSNSSPNLCWVRILLDKMQTLAQGHLDLDSCHMALIRQDQDNAFSMFHLRDFHHCLRCRSSTESSRPSMCHTLVDMEYSKQLQSLVLKLDVLVTLTNLTMEISMIATVKLVATRLPSGYLA